MPSGESTAEPGPEDRELEFPEQYYPARPRGLRLRARLRRRNGSAEGLPGDPVGTNPEYVRWLVEQSMLHDATDIAPQLAGVGGMWQNPYATPDPRRAIETASVWYTAYPISLVTGEGESFLGFYGAPDVWEAFQAIGIEGIHTGPVKEAGGIRGWSATPSVDGHFDRISTRIDPVFGTEDEFRAMCEQANEHAGTVIDDIVPGHTGKGADFRLAEMGVGDYPGIYHMVLIDPADHHLLTDVPAGRDSVNLDPEAERRLEEAGYIVGELQRVIFYEPGVKETNWSVTAPVVGPDGVERRWVYLHYFKDGQPTVNWLDPTFAGMRMVIGDAIHSLADLGSGALRLDANGFLGVERRMEGPAWSEAHPLSEAANQLIASMVRKLGGFTFQELNLAMDDIASSSGTGPDLSYDFVSRPAVHHALATGDTEFLRLVLVEAQRRGVDPASLVHALQNHDELTYELVHFASRHHDEVFHFRGEDLTGEQLAVAVRADLTEHLTGARAPYNRVFTTNGIASTTASVVCGALGIDDLGTIDDEALRLIRRGHLVLTMFNALQPGVVAISGWDLCGMLPLPVEQVADLVAQGDTRWIARPGYDIAGRAPSAERSSSGMPVGRSLYGPVTSQLEDPDSYVSQLRDLLAVRRRHGIATGALLDVPAVAHHSMLVLVHQLADPRERHLLVLNFGTETLDATVQSGELVPGSTVSDMFTGEELHDVDDLHGLSMTLEPLSGRSLLVVAPPAEGQSGSGSSPPPGHIPRV